MTLGILAGEEEGGGTVTEGCADSVQPEDGERLTLLQQEGEPGRANTGNGNQQRCANAALSGRAGAERQP